MIQKIKTTIDNRANVYKSIIVKSYKVSPDEAEHIYSAELETFLNRLGIYMQENPQAVITEAQGANIFLEVMQSGLSFSKVANHVYISRLKGTGTSIGYQVTVDGMVFQAQNAGAIDHLSEPVIVFKGEQFKISNTPDGRQIAVHDILFDGRPQFSFGNLLAGYVYAVFPNGDRELSWLSAERLNQYRMKSANQNMYNDESFIQTKIIKHALRKVRKTPFMRMMQQQDDEVIQNNMEWEEELPNPEQAADYQPTMVVEPASTASQSMAQATTQPAMQPAQTVGAEPF